MHAYEIKPRSDKRGVNLTSDALPFGCLWYGEPDEISNATGYAKLATWTDTHGQPSDFKEP